MCLVGPFSSAVFLIALSIDCQAAQQGQRSSAQVVGSRSWPSTWCLSPWCNTEHGAAPCPPVLYDEKRQRRAKATRQPQDPSKPRGERETVFPVCSAVPAIAKQATLPATGDDGASRSAHITSPVAARSPLNA
ncbi:uncharacterized protein IWZ02DRAFT_446357 [Phyllosticta citriasiana]|uniref:uncharacterized protein n=1 Tax=Phyllosticta citriasiana TaxID=595635 RepID=UPI0030FD98B2